MRMDNELKREITIFIAKGYRAGPCSRYHIAERRRRIFLDLSFSTPSYSPDDCLVCAKQSLAFSNHPHLRPLGMASFVGDGGGNPFHSIGGDFAWCAHAAHSIWSIARFQNGQDHKLLFVNAPVDRRTIAPDGVSRPASPFVVQAGTIIPAALITGIRPDQPGQITAQVTENIFDTPTGRAKLVPQRARLIGIYDSQVAFGQSRVLLVRTRAIME